MEGVQLFELMPRAFGDKLRGLLSQFEDGTLEPLPVTAFRFSEAAEAFRHMAQARHIGKLVLSFADETEMSVAPPRAEPVAMRPDASYLITGGLGGLGLVVARSFVERGARHLVLLLKRVAAGDGGSYTIKDENALRRAARAYTIDEAGRPTETVAREVADRFLGEFTRQEEQLATLRLAPIERRAVWRQRGVEPPGIDRAVVECLHRTTIGVDHNYRNLLRLFVPASLNL